METEFVSLLIESREAGFLSILILLLCSVLAILTGLVVMISSDFLEGENTFDENHKQINNDLWPRN